ncbi:alpha/beta fold hydrolase [Altererythrobacter salegens]|uniref:Alpha/beta fold hydrolase n=1 Tax=Croceibacterium salegens TaxID=1737568 RepID=A0A6I4SVR2_9SPHN|nr:alpha/beta hydrolase [Croceibacterium salegens]MXO60125.1 alpha/beta fold hydrolase [Croceibacterium salegens]
MNKRDFLKLSSGALAAGAAFASTNAKAQVCRAPDSESKTFVLVPGAWCGAFVYDEVASILRTKGHTVHALTLSGLAEDSHRLNNEINLTTHITDIVNAIKFHELDNVVLVSHSYGGVPATGAADRMAERISSLVYLDAFLPKDGDSVLSLSRVPGSPEGPPPGPPPGPSTGGAPAAFPMPTAMMDEFGIPQDQRWRYTPTPIGTGSEPISLTGAVDGIAKKAYLWIRSSPLFQGNYDNYKDDSSWYVEAWDGGHMMMIDEPQKTADFLLRAA